MSSQERIEQIITILDQLADDNTVPRNIRRGATECKDKLRRKEEALDVRIAGAIYKLDEMANDANIPLHGRTLIWNVISQLEQVKQ